MKRSNFIQNKENFILKFILENKKSRVELELKRNRDSILYKFANISRYFKINKKSKELTKFSPKDIIALLNREEVPLKDAYILSIFEKYDKCTLDFTEIILENLLSNGFPSVVIFNENIMLIIGEYEFGHSPKYLLVENSV